MLPSSVKLENQRLLIVDDEETNVALLRRIVESVGILNIETARDGVEAIKKYGSFDPDLIILDLHMPNKDGYEVLTSIRMGEAPGVYLPIVVYTADVTREARERALSLGASDFLTKPCEKTEIKLRIRNLLSLRALYREHHSRSVALDNQVRERTRELEQAQVEIVQRLAAAGEFRDEDTGEHTTRVGDFAAMVAVNMGLEPKLVATIRLAARLHDIGKVGVSDTILLKRGTLTDEEFELMKQHTAIGARILSQSSSPLLQMAERIARSHHERFDGTGYPNGLSGTSIPIEGRIVAVVDVYDALTHKRPYKEAWDEARAIEEIKRCSGTQFDPKVVQAFLAVLAGPCHRAA